jgi:hypothetical protein
LTGASPLREASDTITALFMDATVLSYALEGIYALAASDSRPVLAWEDELEPIRRLTNDVAVRIRELYLAVDPDVARRAQKTLHGWVASAQAEARRVEASAR